MSNIGIPKRAAPQTRGKCGCAFVTLLLLLGVIGALGVGAFLSLRQQQARAEFAPPTVLVTAPAPGAEASAGSYLPVSAMAFGNQPIARVELWLDGELKETQSSSRPEGESTLNAHFALLIPSEGPHSLSVRAVNTIGILGKSLPVSIVGVPKPRDAAYAVRVQPGETLEDIAKTYGSDAATLQKANPNLGGQEPAAGTVIHVPIPPEEEPPTASPLLPVPGNAPVPVPNVPPLAEMQASLLSTGFAFAPPAAPSGLQGEVKGCDVTLRWDDNATNESRYEVWSAMGMLAPRLVASLSPSPTKGPAWYKFFAPQTGYVTFWVEAVNASSHQPSNEITLYIDPQKCSWTQGSGLYLMVQVFEMTVQGNYDQVYCYVSYEGNPERRIPENAGDFIQVKAGTADFGGTTVGQEGKMFARLIPVPKDGALDVEGKCLGRLGQNPPVDLGYFVGKYTANEWDGARRKVKGATYEIEFAVKPWTPAVEMAEMGEYWYEDPSLPAPYDLKESGVRYIFPPPDYDPRERALYWKWDGDPKRITGFQVYRSSVSYADYQGGDAHNPPQPPAEWKKTVPYGYYPGADRRGADVETFYCGRRVRWEVAAVADLAQSPRTALEINLPPCHTYAMVKFEEIELRNCDDDPFDAYFLIMIHDNGDVSALRRFGSGPIGFGEGGFFIPLHCGRHSFLDLAGTFDESPTADTLLIPIETDSIDVTVWTRFADHNVIGSDDTITNYSARHQYPTLKDAQADLGCGKRFESGWLGKKFFKWDFDADARISYTLTVFPNACLDFPLGIPLPEAP